RIVPLIVELPPSGAWTVSAPARDSDAVAPLLSLMPRGSAARTNASFDDGRVRRTLRSLAAPAALRAWNTTSGLVARPRTFTTSAGLAVLGACVGGAAGGAGAGAAAGGVAVGSGAG